MSNPEFIFITISFALLIGVAYWMRIPRASIPLAAVYIIFVIFSKGTTLPKPIEHSNAIPTPISKQAIDEKMITGLQQDKSLIVNVQPKPLVFDSGRTSKDITVPKQNSQELTKIEKDKSTHEKTADQLNNTRPIIKDIRICKTVSNRNPIGAHTYFRNNVDSLYCYTRIHNPGGKQEVTHLWYYKKKLISQVRYNIKRSNIYRSWTRKTILPFQVGSWRVDVQDSSRTVIGSKSFYITDSETNP
jgi:hypothetical protein